MDWRKPDIPDKYRKLGHQARAGKPKAAIRLHCLGMLLLGTQRGETLHRNGLRALPASQ